MRIGINASFLRKPGTGIGQVTLNFLETLKDLPDAGTDEFFIYTEEAREEAERYPKNFHFRNFLTWWKRDDLIRKVLWERGVARQAQEDGCDAFISLYQCSTVFQNSKIKNQKSSIFHTMVVHDLIPRLFPAYQGNMRQHYHWQRVERGMRHADRIIAVSEATENDLVEFGVAREKIAVAYPDTSPLFRRSPSPEEENHVMATYHLVPGYIYHGGGLEVRKNTEGVLRAYKMLVEKEKQGELGLGLSLPPLVISGKIFPETQKLATPVKRLLRELGLNEKVVLLDFVPESDIPALYKNALFFVYPSLYEGFGLPVLEALRMRTPVLTSDGSSLPEVAGDAALYIDPEQEASIASGMERLLSDAALRTTLSAAAETRLDRFSYQEFVRSILHSLRA